MQPLAGKVAVVTGGASGIGFTLARALGERGAALLIADRAGAEDAAGRLREAGLTAEGIAGRIESLLRPA